MTAEIILDILDMVDFKRGTFLPFALKSSSPFLPLFRCVRYAREYVLKLGQIRQTEMTSPPLASQHDIRWLVFPNCVFFFLSNLLQLVMNSTIWINYLL